jgi:hypothetical protein
MNSVSCGFTIRIGPVKTRARAASAWAPENAVRIIILRRVFLPDIRKLDIANIVMHIIRGWKKISIRWIRNIRKGFYLRSIRYWLH